MKTKEKLISSAILLFHKKGIHWVGFAEIGKKAKITQSGLYKYFEDKDALIMECAITVAENGRQLIDQHIDPYSSAKDQLFSYIKGNFYWLNERPHEASIILALYYFGYNHEKIQNLLIRINQQSTDRIAQKISAGIFEKTWPQQSTQDSARIIHNLIIGEMIKAIHSPEEKQIEQRIEMMTASVEKILRAS